jgi:hypothetical protein
LPGIEWLERELAGQSDLPFVGSAFTGDRKVGQISTGVDIDRKR